MSKTENMKEYKHQYYENNKEKIKTNVVMNRQNNKFHYNLLDLLYRLNSGTRKKIFTITQEKYQIYFDEIEQKYKSHLFDNKYIENKLI